MESRRTGTEPVDIREDNGSAPAGAKETRNRSIPPPFQGGHDENARYPRVPFAARTPPVATFLDPSGVTSPAAGSLTDPAPSPRTARGTAALGRGCAAEDDGAVHDPLGESLTPRFRPSDPTFQDFFAILSVAWSGLVLIYTPFAEQ